MAQINRCMIERHYEERGLYNYKLHSIEDVAAIYEINIDDLQGYNNLSGVDQETFKGFIVNFFNANGMDKRMGLEPKSINFVNKTTYSVSRPADENHEAPYQEVVCEEYKIILPNGKMKQFKKHVYYKEIDPKYWMRADNKQFLRFDYKTDKRKEWLHVLSTTEWY